MAHDNICFSDQCGIGHYSRSPSHASLRGKKASISIQVSGVAFYHHTLFLVQNIFLAAQKNRSKMAGASIDFSASSTSVTIKRSQRASLRSPLTGFFVTGQCLCRSPAAGAHRPSQRIHVMPLSWRHAVNLPESWSQLSDLTLLFFSQIFFRLLHQQPKKSNLWPWVPPRGLASHCQKSMTLSDARNYLSTQRPLEQVKWKHFEKIEAWNEVFRKCPLHCTASRFTSLELINVQPKKSIR